MLQELIQQDELDGGIYNDMRRTEILALLYEYSSQTVNLNKGFYKGH